MDDLTTKLAESLQWILSVPDCKITSPQREKAREALRLYDEAKAQPKQAAEPVILKCEIQPRPLSHPLSDYHHAMSEGPLHYTWQDKPHRLVYDLIAAVRFYATPVAQAEPRKPLTQEQIAKGRRSIRGYEEDDLPDSWAFSEGVRFAEAHHNIKGQP